MDTRLSPGVAVLTLLVLASCFAANHLCARLAFDHGASVVAALSARATFTLVVLLPVMRLRGIRLAIPRELRGKTLLAGLLIASQSYCLYSAVALIPPALALLVFHTSPMLYVLLTWALGKERARWSALWPMALALVGLSFALNLRPGHFDSDWAAIRTGVAWAFASGASMTVVYYLNANALKPLDGRLRTFAMTTVTAVLVIIAGAASGAHAFPRDGVGWLGITLLSCFYCVAIVSLFYVLPRIPATATAAMNFEPIALLVLSWLILGITVAPLQIAGALLTVSAIAWLGLAKG